MLDAMLYILFIAVLLLTARWTLVFLAQAVVSLVQVLVGLTGTLVVAGVFVLILTKLFPFFL